jgi:hypothetical protein
MTDKAISPLRRRLIEDKNSTPSNSGRPSPDHP